MDVLNIVGQSAQQVQMSTGLACSGALSTGGVPRVYAMWGLTQDAYISIGPAPSTALTTANGFLVLGPATAVPPNFIVPPMNYITVTSTSSGILAFEQVA